MTTTTAIIPTVGRRSLRRAVRSAVRQTVDVAPLVVLDRPGALAEVRDLLHGLPHELITTSGGVGGGAARNLGIQAARTDHVAFLDDDDEWTADKAERQLEAVDADRVVSALSLLVGASSRVVPQVPYQTAAGTSVVDYVLDRSTLRLSRHFLQTSSLMCPRDAALQVPWDETLPRHQDWDWIARLEAAGMRIRTVPEVLVRVNQGSAGSVSRSADWRASEHWLRHVARGTASRARADFRMSVIVRGALAAGDWTQAVRQAGVALRENPHPAAVVVGVGGILEGRSPHAS